MSKQKVVVIGGGNGSSFTINALKPFVHKIELSAVISMSDSGGSSGRLREEFNMLPPGDIMRAVIAMSRHDSDLLKFIFYKKRFSGDNKLNGHSLGNLFFALAAQYANNFIEVVRGLEEVVESVGHVYPATLDQTQLVAELSNGSVVKGEMNIDQPAHDRSFKIKQVWLDPDGVVYPEAARVLQAADFIFFGPGDLYTSIVAALLPAGCREAIAESKARLIYVAGNKYTVDGETGPTRLSGFVQALEDYLPRPIDLVIYNSHRLRPKEEVFYEEKNWAIKEYDKENLFNWQVIAKDFERPSGGVSPEKLGKLFNNILFDTTFVWKSKKPAVTTAME